MHRACTFQHYPCWHKWLGCFLTTKNVQGPTLDVEHHLQSAARAWFVHKWVLCDKNIPLGLRLKFFNAVITPVACFAAGHRTLYLRDVRRYDIEMRKMLRRMIPPPVGIDWSAPWHEILHLWHARIDTAVHQFAFLPWSAVVTTKVSQSELAGPKAAPLGRKQKQFKI